MPSCWGFMETKGFPRQEVWLVLVSTLAVVAICWPNVKNWIAPKPVIEATPTGVYIDGRQVKYNDILLVNDGRFGRRKIKVKDIMYDESGDLVFVYYQEDESVIGYSVGIGVLAEDVVRLLSKPPSP